MGMVCMLEINPSEHQENHNSPNGKIVKSPNGTMLKNDLCKNAKENQKFSGTDKIK